MTTTATPTDTTSDANAAADWLIAGHIRAATDERDTAATLLDLGRYCDGLEHDHLAEHHQATADVLNAVASLYRLALAA